MIQDLKGFLLKSNEKSCFYVEAAHFNTDMIWWQDTRGLYALYAIMVILVACSCFFRWHAGSEAGMN